MLEVNRIYNEDCLGDNGLKLIDDKSIDLILCDLPYEKTRNKWDSIISMVPLWKEYKRIIKDRGAIALTATFDFAAKLYEYKSIPFRYDIVWSKNKTTGFYNANKMPMRQHELVLIFYKKLPIYNPQKTYDHKPVNSYKRKVSSAGSNYGATKDDMNGGGQTERHPTSVWDIPVMNNDDPNKWHPTQKPVELFERIIKSYTNEGDLVLDNAAGACTTAHAAINTGRQYICFEKEKEYYDRAAEDINEKYIMRTHGGHYNDTN